MPKLIIIVASGISQENILLQPWRYLYEIARAFAGCSGYKVILLTEGFNDQELEVWQPNLHILRTRHLSVFSQNKLLEVISKLNPVQLWWSLTPRSVGYLWIFFKIRCVKYGLVTCPLYSFKTLLKASLIGVPFVELKALWLQRIVPRFFFVNLVNSRFLHKTYVQSLANQEVLISSGVMKNKVGLIRVGVDLDDQRKELYRDRQMKMKEGFEKVTFLFFGSPKVIRGFDLLLESFALATHKGMNARLNILARGANSKSITEINRRLDELKITSHVSIEGGWLAKQDVRDRLVDSDVVVLPFIVVPSDVPIAILEAMAYGKPVIGTAVDGIPELIKNRGVIVEPLNVENLAEKLVFLSENSILRGELGENARHYMRTYPNWSDISAQVLKEAGLGFSAH